MESATNRAFWPERTHKGMPSRAIVLVLAGVALSALTGALHLTIHWHTPAAIPQSRTEALTLNSARLVRITGNDSLGHLSATVVRVGIGSEAVSGFLWNSQGHMVTSAAALQGKTQVEVTLPDGTRYPARLVAADLPSDVAVLAIQAQGLSFQSLPAALPDDQLRGSKVFLVVPHEDRVILTGHVMEEHLTLARRSASLGTTFAVPDILRIQMPFPTQARGAPLVNANGEVVGMLLETKERMGYALSMAVVARIVPALLSEGSYKHPWLGISGASMTPEFATLMEVQTTKGVLILSVLPGSPAALAGLQPGNALVRLHNKLLRVGGDIIVSVDGHPVDDLNMFLATIARYGTPGRPLTLEIVRHGRHQTLTVVLGASPSVPILN